MSESNSLTAPNQAPSFSIARRRLLQTAAASLVAGGAASVGLLPSSASAASPLWPGHKPGKVYLGVCCGGQMALSERRAGGKFGVNRTYYQWTQAAREDKLIRSDHAAGRLPWISFKPPAHTRGIWRQIASGRYDADIRARARRYALLSKPVIVTFNHEPHTDLDIGTASEFASAWCRIHDVMNDETGLKNVASVPILGDWIYNPTNKRDDPDEFAPAALLSRCSFLGIDLYQNQSTQGFRQRIPVILDHARRQGFPKMTVGIGEVGARNGLSSMTGAQWWSDSWNWAIANPDKIGVATYWDRPTGWVIDETAAKQSAIRASRSASAFL